MGYQDIQILELNLGYNLTFSDYQMISAYGTNGYLLDVNVDDVGDFWVSDYDRSIVRIP